MAARRKTGDHVRMLMKAEQSALLIIDVQQVLAPAMHGIGPVIDNAAILMQAAGRLSIPVLTSEQYPKGLGPTVRELAGLAGAETVEKLSFSCFGDDVWRARFSELGRPQAVIAGIEAHVCVLQTAMDLLEGCSAVFIVRDATTSRTPENHAAAMDRLAAAGAEIVTTEMVLFEWLGRAGTDEFKELSKLIK